MARGSGCARLTNTGYHGYFTTVESGAGNSDKGAGENSDTLPSKSDSADIHVDEACTLECLYIVSRHTNILSTVFALLCIAL